MTERQIMGFYAAVRRRDCSRRADAIEDSAAAINAAMGSKEAAALPRKLRNAR